MGEGDWLAERFQENRNHLRAVAYRMLGSLAEADDAVQETWLRLSRSDTGGVRNLGGWLATVVARVCLDVLRSRKSRREVALGVHLPEPIVSREDRTDPEPALIVDHFAMRNLRQIVEADHVGRLSGFRRDTRLDFRQSISVHRTLSTFPRYDIRSANTEKTRRIGCPRESRVPLNHWKELVRPPRFERGTLSSGGPSGEKSTTPDDSSESVL